MFPNLVEKANEIIRHAPPRYEPPQHDNRVTSPTVSAILPHGNDEIFQNERSPQEEEENEDDDEEDDGFTAKSVADFRFSFPSSYFRPFF